MAGCILTCVKRASLEKALLPREKEYIAFAVQPAGMINNNFILLLRVLHPSSFLIDSILFVVQQTRCSSRVNIVEIRYRGTLGTITWKKFVLRRECDVQAYASNWSLSVVLC